MKVEVVGITQPLVDGIKTPDEFIAYCARVSNPGNQMNTLTASKLISYCIKKKHWSIFEMVSVVMSIETTRDIGRQILRHRSFSFQEFSQRYANSEAFVGTAWRETRLQDPKNRQNSIETDNLQLQLDWEDWQGDISCLAIEAYKWAIENGIAKEQARAVLPEGLTLTRMYMTGTLRSWITYIHTRTEEGTQKEHMEIAEAIKLKIIEYFPSLKDHFQV